MAKWATRGHKRWLELWRNEGGSYTYIEDNGVGYMGHVNKYEAVAQMALKVDQYRKYDRINLQEVEL